MTQTTLREYLRTIEDTISSGRINEAMADCQNILSYFPEALEAQHLLGEVYLAQGQLEEAQQTFEWILTNDPENVIVYCDRALISERLSDIDTALDCYQQAYELSRGNANIRQEFNQLSARAGQQEFMFSRAGLARLYMRGNLLTQAIQEWEAVLAISPDRLDARLGLIETYWREGLFDKAEQFASQLLEEIPTCLKALLYLAHIASISNITRAKDLLARAETLDPELHMAQEVFADLAASQPNDPFLVLIQKEPILLEDGIPVNRPVARKPVPAPNAAPGTWSMPPQAATGASPLSPIPSGADWNANNANSGALPMPNQDLPELHPWQEQLAATARVEQPWYESDQYVTTHVTGNPSTQHWDNQPNDSPDLHSWNGDTPEPEEEQPTPPAWLGTLTQSEQSQVEDSISQIPQAPPALPPTDTTAYPLAPPQAVQDDDAMPFFFPSDTTENEGEMGWPAWLKSLGAESLEPETADESSAQVEPTLVPSTRNDPYTHQSEHETDPWATPAASANPTSQSQTPSQPDWMQQLSVPNQELAQSSSPDWMQQISTAAHEPVQSSSPDWMQQISTAAHEPAQSSSPDWMQQISSAAHEPMQSSSPDWIQQISTAAHEPVQSSSPDWMQQFTGRESQVSPEATTPLTEQEQRYIASLEDLEKNLQSQGFAPLTPGTLAALAQANTTIPDQPQEQPSLSSALAQLGNFAQPSVAQPASATSNEPWWNAMLSQASEQPIPTTSSMFFDEQTQPFTPLTQEVIPPMPTLPATPAPLPPAFFQPSAGQIPPMSPPLMPAYRSDALLDSDLETTMKRPAIKLQPMQVGPSSDRSYANGKSHQSERPSSELNDDSTLNNHERLVRGYQHQLSGAYDEAMNDYRLIIRNAPELLDDVISNMRALLKLNPRFSLGYRVLGDAYMKKGEYLQAMEAYNKALTMAKKAKS